MSGGQLRGEHQLAGLTGLMCCHAPLKNTPPAPNPLFKLLLPLKSVEETFESGQKRMSLLILSQWHPVNNSVWPQQKGFEVSLP